jgi:hypothetical protein
MEQIFMKMLGMHLKKEYNAFQNNVHRETLIVGIDIEISGEKEGK